MPNATPTQEALANELDEALLESVKAQKGADEPNAAIFNAAIARLKALGITHMVQPDSAAAAMMNELGLDNPNVMKFPDISDEETATGT